jgi:hypothetical protein
MKKWKNRCTAWIACLAILAAAFVPSISAALVLAHENAAFTAPICSSDHSQHQSVVQEHAPEHHAGHTDHCPLCVKQGSGLDMLRLPDFFLPERAAPLRADAPHHDSAHSSLAWIHRPSRAPPVRI